ncbi:UDP-N-acetylglucosamine 2-epimerase (non-hydrolyzing) [Thiocystis minor]|uniref:non-hydrolyzing UDP-N-acetylglucosamine 2-epimerase n=1 Tax=Thiocystis minor TaxID=61597 RepID=UPI0019122E68|nr:UDP-N-acetylglucosamine 2-epimerase (non-hydrolyzing) [Thiocystis minor]MBK5966115.1 UDP-N-acetylglucosamine 2-epimerase (non-hydrolyzing) [Thiocystis minor]
MKKKILCIVGTRPEAIKMAPVILALKAASWVNVRVLATAQHRQMLDQVLSLFDIVPDIDLDVMRPNQTLPALTARLMTALDACFEDEAPDAVLAQGDTTTVMVAALAAFYRRIPFGHVEAGLRTGDLFNPFPEEMNRIVAGNLARWHFAPTESARRNLLAETLPEDAIFVTGNTVIDALLDIAERCDDVAPAIPSGQRLVLVTAHRRENFGEPFAQICRAIRHLADRREDVTFLYPVHPNPNVKEIACALLGGHPRIQLCEPLDYLPFVAAMKRAHFILSDSGGVQEEAPALGKPVLVLRRETERPEAVTEGVVKLVGPDFDAIVRESLRLLDDADAYRAMARGVSPYGDGKAAARICEILRTSFV